MEEETVKGKRFNPKIFVVTAFALYAAFALLMPHVADLQQEGKPAWLVSAYVEGRILGIKNGLMTILQPRDANAQAQNPNPGYPQGAPATPAGAPSIAGGPLGGTGRVPQSQFLVTTTTLSNAQSGIVQYPAIGYPAVAYPHCFAAISSPAPPLAADVAMCQVTSTATTTAFVTASNTVTATYTVAAYNIQAAGTPSAAYNVYLTK
jgi:hypothetical protein